MPGTQAGVYPGALDAGTEVSSTYKGRHITVRDDELIHTKHDDGFVDKGDPVIVCDAAAPTTYGMAVGVALLSASSTADFIAIDTEGIWNLPVYAEDDDGDSDIEIGDPLFIRAGALPGAADGDGTGDAEISKISNSVVQVPFGYALGSLTGGGVGVIAVKVHCDPLMVGNVADKGIDHVQGTIANPIAWGVNTSNVKSVIMSTGIMTDYISGLFMRAYATAATPAGGIQGLIYSRITAEDDVQDMYGVRGRTDLVMDTPGAHIANMVVGVMGSVSLDNAGSALTIADSLKGGDFSAAQTATSTITTGSIRAIYADISNVKTDNSGRTQGIFVKQGGGGTSYPDYGILCHLESNNLLSAIYIRTNTSCIAPIGILWGDDGSGSITAAMKFDTSITNVLHFVSDDGTEGCTADTDATGANATHKIRCVSNGTTFYIAGFADF